MTCRSTAATSWPGCGAWTSGGSPLFLLDANHPDNSPTDRWITGRLYDGNPQVRLAQYAMLGIGAIRAMDRMGIEPGLLHLNEGHPALAPLEQVAARVGAGATFSDAADEVRRRTVFTTHTPGAGRQRDLPDAPVHGRAARRPADGCRSTSTGCCPWRASIPTTTAASPG